MKSTMQYSPDVSPKGGRRSYSRSSRSSSSASEKSRSPSPKRSRNVNHERRDDRYAPAAVSSRGRDGRNRDPGARDNRDGGTRDYRDTHNRRERSGGERADSGRQGNSSKGSYSRRDDQGGHERPDEREKRSKGLKPGQEFAYFKRRGSPTLEMDAPDNQEDRDMRTVFVWQLAARIRPRDLEDFFSAVGQVRDVRLIMDSRTQRSKGIAYVEFYQLESVDKAVRLTGTKLLGVPINVQMSQAEKNRAASLTAMSASGEHVTFSDNLPMKLYVGSLHYNITEPMVRNIFESFGKIDDVKLMRDPVSNQSHGYAFVHFARGADAKKAMEQMNGYELAGRPIKVNYVLERAETTVTERSLDIDEVDRTGLNLGSTGRLALMAKLAEGTGLQLPKATQNALAMAGTALPSSTTSTTPIVIPTTCIKLSNMFDTRENTAFDEIREDVLDECSLLGPVMHIHVDRTPSSRGSVYVKLGTIATAAMCVNKLNGRFFSGRVITAEFFPVAEYNRLFPDSVPKRTTT